MAYSITEHPISALLNDDNNPFPLPSAIALDFYNGTDNPTGFYFQPYHTDVACFMNSSRFRAPVTDVNNSFPCVKDCGIPGSEMRMPYFSERAWSLFSGNNMIAPGGRDHAAYLECVNMTYPCRYEVHMYMLQHQVYTLHL